MASLLAETVAVIKGRRWKEVSTFLFFLLLAVIFWLLQSIGVEFERNVPVTLRYVNIPNGYSLRDDNPATVNIALRDKGLRVFYHYRNRQFEPVEIPVSVLSRMSDSVMIVPRELIQQAVRKQLLSSSTIVAVEPADIELKYSYD
jgi:hypothetical protein